MRRRQVLYYAGASFFATLGAGLLAHLPGVQAQEGSLSIQWLGHTCFVFKGGGQQILVNPFRPIGCTQGYPAPKVTADLVMISSRLLDEGAIDNLAPNQRLLFEPGVYQLGNIQIQGIRMERRLENGRWFPNNIAWRWPQAGINILHLGGAATPITLEQRILMGQPDLLIVPVGNGAKAYSPDQAIAAIQVLNPKLVIPCHYRTAAADANTCDLVDLQAFLDRVTAFPIRRTNSNTLSLTRANLPTTGPVIQVLGSA